MLLVMFWLKYVLLWAATLQTLSKMRDKLGIYFLKRLSYAKMSLSKRTELIIKTEGRKCNGRCAW